MTERGLRYRRRIVWTAEGPILEEELVTAERLLFEHGPVREAALRLPSGTREFVGGLGRGLAWGFYGTLAATAILLLLGVLL